MDSFNLKQFLVENKLTENSRLNEIKATPKNTGVGKQRFSLEKWENLGEDFKYDSDDDIYIYYGILFFNDPELKELSSEIQYNDYTEEEWETIEEKIETLIEILNKNNIEWSQRTTSNWINFTIYYENSKLNEIKATPKNTGLVTPKQIATDLVNQAQPDFEEDKYTAVSIPVSEVNPKFIEYLKSLPTDNDYPNQSGIATFDIVYNGIKWKIIFYLVYVAYDKDMVVFELSALHL